jgi:hypothetical protein
MNLDRPTFASSSAAAAFAALALSVLSAGCATASLSRQGAKVAATRNPPGPDCTALKYLVGKGGGTFGGDMVPNEDLVEYAMNDLRNKAAKLGADYIQHDPPMMGAGPKGVTTTVTISGTAYRCAGASVRTTSSSTD